MRISYDDALPVSARRHEIAEAIADHQVVVLAGETGSGKTTQLPKILHELGRTAIVHTQPRRIAARSVARRIAEECQVELGAEVGYAVRFDDATSEATTIRLVTDGLLLQQIHADRELRRYDTVVIDEAHERSLAIDFLLGYLRQLLPRRPDLKVVITSATIEVDRFAAMFDAPVLEVSGRTYPVEIRYRPLDDPDSGLLDGIVAALTELPLAGDVLVFLSGEREIRDATEHLASQQYPRTEILPLYGRLAAADQQRVFSSHPGRRIVLATNVAETSLTVPGIRFVIDAGYARISRYSRRLKVQRLPIEPISQASAAQRAGRCGRVADGICIRLYAEEDHDGRPAFTDPEILRTNLASVLLQMAQLDLGAMTEFPFLDPPDHRVVTDGVQLLRELGAFAPRDRDRRGRTAPARGCPGDDRLTRLGRTMAALPLDPRLARMLLAADRQGCLADVLVVVAAMSIQDPRERPLEHQQAADAQHARFRQPDSDFLSYLSLWSYLREQRDARSHSAFRRMCREEFLHYLRIREWQDVHAQLRRTVRDLGLKPGRTPGPERPPDADAVHRALLTGLLSHVGLRETDGREYLGARGARFAVFPGSGLARKPPRWVMAGELVETSRLFARTVAKVEPEWIEQAAGHLVSRQHAEPHWSIRRGAAMAKERVTLYGIPLVVDRPVPVARIDPATARELFIRHALVQGEWRTRHDFWHENARRLARVEELENRLRRRDLRVDDDVLYAFYDERVPTDVVSVRHFDAWWTTTRRTTPDLLTMDPARLSAGSAGDVDSLFPTTWTSQSTEYAVRYAFEPGSSSDGVTVDVALADLADSEPGTFAWGVPGQREEMVTALLRGLPKPLRRQLVPAPDHARRLVEEIDPTSSDVPAELSRAILATTGVHVPADAVDLTGLPRHLRTGFRILDDDGRTIDEDTDLAALRHRLRPRVRAGIAEAARPQERSGLTAWEIGTLESEVAVAGSTAYPALVDEGTTAGLRFLPTATEQATEGVRGQARLLALAQPSPVPLIGRELGARDKLILATAPYSDPAAVIEDARLAALDHLVGEHGPATDADTFARLDRAVRPETYAVTLAAVREVVATQDAVGRLVLPDGPDGEDVAVQLSWLIYPGYVRETGVRWLPRLPRYLEAARRHLAGPPRPALADIAELEARCHELTVECGETERRDPRIVHARWALEELRLAVFAPGVATAFPISVKRMRRILDDLERALTSG